MGLQAAENLRFQGIVPRRDFFLTGIIRGKHFTFGEYPCFNYVFQRNIRSFCAL